MARKLGIDYGDSRTGFAITDPLGITVQGLGTLNTQGSDKIILNKIEEYLKEYEIDTFVIGFPINMNGTEGDRAKKTEQFIHKLNSRFNKIPVEKIDERLTTVMAHKTMNFLNINNRKKKSIVDTLSAVYILEDYMKKIKN